MKHLLGILSLFFLMCCIQQCECKKETPELICDANNTVNLPKLCKDLFVFKIGTWWVYKDVNSSSTDSFYVASFADYTGNNLIYKKLVDVSKLKKCYEAYSVSIKSQLIGNINQDISITVPIDNDQYQERPFHVTEFNEVTSAGYYKVEFIGDSIRQSDELKNEITHHDSILVNGKYHLDIFEILGNNNSKDFTPLAYFQRGIGLIKYRRKDNTAWELINYNIVQ